MRHHTVEIGDRRGHSFKIHIATNNPWDDLRSLLGGQTVDIPLQITGGTARYATLRQKPGTWRAIDKGSIVFNSGKVAMSSTGEDLSTVELYLLNLDGTWGMKLFNYEDMFGVNDEGEGFVIQPWVLNFGVGRFSWSLVDGLAGIALDREGTGGSQLR